MSVRLKIVVPVHRGAGLIGETLRALADQVTGEMAVAVIVNGPADGAAAVARPILDAIAARGAWTGVATLASASRPASLTAGDRMGPGGGHRLYLDQDALLSSGGLAAIMAALDGGTDFVAGRAEWRGSSPLACRAMACWSALPYVRRSPATAGMYALSERARARWTDWPEQLPDDKFARMMIAPSDRQSLGEVSYRVQAPSDIAALIAARRRYRASNRALALAHPDLMAQDDGRSLIGNLVRLPLRHWPGATILGGAELVARWRS